MGVGSAMAGGCNVARVLRRQQRPFLCGPRNDGGLARRRLPRAAVSLLGNDAPPLIAAQRGGAVKRSTFSFWNPTSAPSSFWGALVARMGFTPRRRIRGWGACCFAASPSASSFNGPGFVFVRCFRDPFMTGEADMAKAVSFSIIIGVLGFAALKWTGAQAGERLCHPHLLVRKPDRAEPCSVSACCFRAGCGSGSVWRAGEGHVKLMVVVLFFAATNSLFKAVINSSGRFQKADRHAGLHARYHGV